MTLAKLHEERFQRILQAVSLEEPDRTPVVLEYSAFAAQVTGTTVAEFLESAEKNLEIMLKAFEIIGDSDAVNYGSFWPYGLAYLFMSKVRVPGVELAADDMWQVVETELMTREDYDRILERGWPQFNRQFMKERVLEDAAEKFFPPNWKPVDVLNAWKAIGVPVLNGGNITTPIEVLCGSRSLAEFACDLVDIPDKVEAAMEAIVPHLAGRAIDSAKKLNFPAVWVGGWRSAPSLYSPVMWNRFAWPYFSRLVNEVVEAGLIAILHLDSDWTRELDRFLELPRGRCIMALDGETDIFKAKETLDGHMCLMGDVPATMLYLGQPEEVYDYSSRLIRELGPRGFILQSGCDIPANAKPENVKAMVRAATG